MVNTGALLLGLALSLLIVLGPGASSFDLTSAFRGIALYAVLDFLVLPSIARYWRATHDPPR